MTDQHQNTHGAIRDSIDQARDTASHAYETAREKALDAAQQTAATLESNPVGMIVGGLALGALVAAVLPRGQREKELLAPVGQRIAAAANAAMTAAKDAGRQELNELGLSRSAAGDRARGLLDGIIKAATSASTAAVDAGKQAAKSQ